MTAPAHRAACRRGTSLLLVLVLCSAAALAGGPDVRLARDAGSASTLTIDVGPVAWRTFDGAFVPVIEGFGSLGTVAAPDVPARRERIALEPGTELVLSSVDVQWSEGRLPGAIAPYPAADPKRAPIDADLAARGWWPTEIARVVTPEAAFRTLRFGEVLIAPLQVDLASGTFRVASRITLRFVAPAASAASARAVRTAVERDPLVEMLGESLARGARDVGRAAPSSTSKQSLAPEAAPTFPAWQFDVKTDGLYRITYAWAQTNAPGLLAFLTSTPPAQYHLSTQGVDVPLEVSVANGTTFSPGDYIEFYGQGTSNLAVLNPPADRWQGGRITPVNVYRLDAASNPARIAAVPGARPPQSGYSVPSTFRTTAHGETDGFFQGFMEQDGLDHWLAGNALAYCFTPTSDHPCSDPLPNATCGSNCGAGSVCCAGSIDQFVDTPGHAGGSVAIRARIHGYNYDNDFHRTELRVDGTLRDTADWDGYVEFTQGVDQGARSFTPAAPLAAQSKVTLRTQIGRTGATQDFVALNWAELDYDRLYQGVAGKLAFSVANDAGHEVHVDALSDAAEIWELTETSASAAGMSIVQPRQVPTWTTVSGQLRFELDPRGGLPATRSFLAVSPSGMLTPVAVRQDLPPSGTDATLGSSLKTSGNGADWIVIGERSLLNLNAGSQLNALVARRKATNGFKTAVIDVRDIYDEFGAGLEHPQAIHDFVAYALANWVPAPKYVVLVGDTTWDFQNAYGWSPRRQFVPSMMKDITANTQFGYYASDTWLTAVGGTSLPSVLIGRLPAHSQAEAETMFNKVVSYEQAGTGAPSWAARALLVSERKADVTEFDYINEHDAIYNRYFTGLWGPQTATKLYENDPRNDPSCSVPRELTGRIQSASNAGAAVLSFAGHGGFKSWGSGCQPIFATEKASPDDLDGINSGSRLQFQIHANCITGAVTQDAPTSTTNDPWYTFLESWITRSGKGIIAGIAPSHLSNNFLLDATLDPIYQSIFGKRKERTVGLIDLRLRQNLASLNDTSGVESYILAGDPATKLAVPAPPAPTLNPIATAGSHQLQLTWSAVSGVNTYKVYRSESPYTTFTSVNTTSATSYLDTGLVNCRTYYYYVVSVDANGFESAWSNFNETCFGDGSDCRSGVPQNPAAPSAPTGLVVTDTQFGGELKATWAKNPETDVVGYTLFWGTTPGGPYPNSAPTANLEYTVGNLQNGVRYYFTVRAENCSRAGALSAEQSQVPHKVLGINPPDAISDLKVQRDGKTSNLLLTWTNPTQTVWGTATSVTSVEVYGDPTTPAFKMDTAHKLATLTVAPLTSWKHLGAWADGKRWYYTVVPVDGSGLRGAPGDELPDGVAGLTLQRIGSTQVKLSWPPLRQDVNGKPMTIKDYNLYGQTTPFSRAACTAANRIVPAINATTYTQCMPGTNQPPLCSTAQRNYFWQLLGEDSHGAEAVW